MTFGVRRGGVVLVFVRSRRSVSLESVTFMSCDARIFLIRLVIELSVELSGCHWDFKFLFYVLFYVSVLRSL